MIKAIKQFIATIKKTWHIEKELKKTNDKVRKMLGRV